MYSMFFFCYYYKRNVCALAFGQITNDFHAESCLCRAHLIRKHFDTFGARVGI